MTIAHEIRQIVERFRCRDISEPIPLQPGLLRQEPRERARRLLLENLTPAQTEEYRRDGSFTVDTEGQQYELKPDITVRRSDGTRFCAVAPDLPLEDQLLARKLLLENDPTSFFGVANRFFESNNRFPSMVSSRCDFDLSICSSVSYIQSPLFQPDINLSEYLTIFASDCLETRGFDRQRCNVAIEVRPDRRDREIVISYDDITARCILDYDHFVNGGAVFDIVRLTVERCVDILTRQVIASYRPRAQGMISDAR